MPQWISYFFMGNFILIAALGIRTTYYWFKFLNHIRIKEPEKAKEFGISSNSFFGTIETSKALSSKNKCLDPQLELLRNKTRKVGGYFFMSWTPVFLLFFFFILKFIIIILSKK